MQAMHPITAAVWLQTFIALGSAGLLYFSFKRHLDASARYMLIGELMVVLSAGTFALADTLQLGPNQAQTQYFLINAAVIQSEIAILFSLMALNRPMPAKWFVLGLLLTLTWVSMIEWLRSSISLDMIVMLSSLAPAAVAILTFYLCLQMVSDRFRRNLFVRLVLICQVGVIGFWVTRAALSTQNVLISVIEPSHLSMLMIIGYITFSVFRYIAYVGIRVSWVMQDYQDTNRLNAELVQAMRERDQFFQRLITANKAIGLGAFSAAIAHQLNQPLTALTMQANVIKREIDQPNCDRNRAATAATALIDLSRKLTDLVRSLHSLFVNTQTRRETIELVKLTREVQQFLVPMLQEHHINMNLRATDNPLIQADSSQVQQVLLNVLSNAAQACLRSLAQHNQIDIVIEQQDDKVLMTVSDTGPGVSEQFMIDAFEAFATTSPDGMGMGLWLSRTIMTQHHGQILMANKPSGGTIVTITFPLTQHP
jgi:signal transduction histidine kinase